MALTNTFPYEDFFVYNVLMNIYAHINTPQYMAYQIEFEPQVSTCSKKQRGPNQKDTMFASVTV